MAVDHVTDVIVAISVMVAGTRTSFEAASEAVGATQGGGASDAQPPRALDHVVAWPSNEVRVPAAAYHLSRIAAVATARYSGTDPRMTFSPAGNRRQRHGL
jgi:hypothetical protein